MPQKGVWLWTALTLCIVGGAVLAHENDGPPGTGDPNIDIFHAAAAVRTRPRKTTCHNSKIDLVYSAHVEGCT
jgi:hypothetical protein